MQVSTLGTFVLCTTFRLPSLVPNDGTDGAPAPPVPGRPLRTGERRRARGCLRLDWRIRAALAAELLRVVVGGVAAWWVRRCECCCCDCGCSCCSCCARAPAAVTLAAERQRPALGSRGAADSSRVSRDRGDEVEAQQVVILCSAACRTCRTCERASIGDTAEIPAHFYRCSSRSRLLRHVGCRLPRLAPRDGEELGRELERRALAGASTFHCASCATVRAGCSLS